jgi:hypothetical protein
LIDARDAPGTRRKRRYGPRSHVGEHVEHAIARLHVAAQAGAVVPLIVKIPRLLPGAQRRRDRHIALEHVDALGNLAKRYVERFDPLERAGRSRIAQQHSARRENVRHGREDRLAELHHARGVELCDARIAVAVDYEPRKPVGLAVHHAIERRAEDLLS